MLRTTSRALPALAVVLALAGCGGGGSTTAAAPSTPTVSTPAPTYTPPTGPEAFANDLAMVGFGSKDTSDPGFLALGNQTCQAFQDGSVSFGSQVQAYVESDAKPTLAQAENLVRSAVRNLCPEQATMLP